MLKWVVNEPRLSYLPFNANSNANTNQTSNGTNKKEEQFMANFLDDEALLLPLQTKNVIKLETSEHLQKSSPKPSYKHYAATLPTYGVEYSPADSRVVQHSGLDEDSYLLTWPDRILDAVAETKVPRSVGLKTDSSSLQEINYSVLEWLIVSMIKNSLPQEKVVEKLNKTSQQISPDSGHNSPSHNSSFIKNYENYFETNTNLPKRRLSFSENCVGA